MLYYSFIRAYIHYGHIAWKKCGTNLKKMDIQQKHAIDIMHLNDVFARAKKAF